MRPTYNRRQVLSGIGSAALVGSATPVLGKRNSEKVRALKGSYKSPLTQEELNKAVTDVAAAHGINVDTRTNPKSKGELVSYVVTVVDGTIHEDIAFAVSPEDVPGLHQRNKEKAQQFQTSGDMETQSSGTEDWYEMYNSDIVTKDCPYGAIQNKYIFYRDTEKGDHHSLRDETWLYPGRMDTICEESGYTLSSGETRHDWARGGHDMDFDDHSPRGDGNRDGTVTVSLESSRTPLSIEYSTEVDGTYYDDKSVEFEDLGHWEFTVSGDAQKTTSILDTNSLAYVESYEGDWMEYVQLYTECIFKSLEGYPTSIDHSVSITG